MQRKVDTNPVGVGILPIKHGSPSVSMPGYDVRILDAEGAEVATGEMGEVAPKLPLPPGAAVTLLNANDRYEESYLQRYAGYFNRRRIPRQDGYAWVVGCTMTA